MKVIVTPQAEHDLDEIGAYIARDSRKAAIRVLTAIRARLRRLGKFPRIGQAFDVSSRMDLRRIVWGSYLIVYFVTDEAVVVVRIVHGARDLTALFRERRSDAVENE